MITKKNESLGHYSPRNSILIWVAGIVLGWGCAVVVAYQIIKGPDSAVNGGNSATSIVAQSQASPADPDSLAAIEPAAGN